MQARYTFFMSFKHFFILPALILLIFLGIYTWNQRTSILDSFSLRTGLEIGSTVLKTTQGASHYLQELWTHYINLVGVQEENQRLKQQIADIKARMELSVEDQAELIRLRNQLQLTPPEHWEALGCRVLGRRVGPNSPQLSITLGRGYLTGSMSEAPVMTPSSVAGVVLRAGPYTSTALLLTDPSVHIAVVTQRSRIQGILSGTGAFNPLTLEFIPYYAKLEEDELLITSGMDGIYPKGLPVAKISSVTIPEVGSFLSIYAEPLADLSKLEEVQVLVRKPHSALDLLTTLPSSSEQ